MPSGLVVPHDYYLIFSHLHAAERFVTQGRRVVKREIRARAGAKNRLLSRKRDFIASNR